MGPARPERLTEEAGIDDAVNAAELMAGAGQER